MPTIISLTENLHQTAAQPRSEDAALSRLQHLDYTVHGACAFDGSRQVLKHRRLVFMDEADKRSSTEGPCS